MPKSEDVVIHMQRVFDKEIINKISWLTGNEKELVDLLDAPSWIPFDDRVIDFLSAVSKVIMADARSRAYPDVITFAFWIREASMVGFKKMIHADENLCFGRGILFHIAPSNVAVNFAYSLVAGMITGNRNIVRAPSRDFEQIRIINDAFGTVLTKEDYKDIRNRVIIVRYGRDRSVNDLFSSIADTRIVWGGDNTINELRQSPLPARATEVTFADRFSAALINSDKYLAIDDKKRFAEEFYNDTYLTDQNACTSPRIVIWTGDSKTQAKEKFWDELHEIVKKRYPFQDVQAVNKLTSLCLVAVGLCGIKKIDMPDNLITRLHIEKLTDEIVHFMDNSGFFFEYDCDDILELKPLYFDKRFQTLGILENKESLMPLLLSGGGGIDRVVKIGKTMDFEFVWDGYDLISQLTRSIRISF